MKVLVMGGTRFIGVYLTRLLVAAGHEVTLFNRGKRPAPVAGLRQITGDRTDPEQLQAQLRGESFDAIFDNNGRELSDTQPLFNLFQGKLQHFVYISSAGVYLKTDQPPHLEGDPVDPKSRHRGKFETEEGLAAANIPWTSIRPVYIYGPGNYNPLEAWFFDRIVRDRPVPVPGNGQSITQLGHVADLAQAMLAVLGNEAAIGQIFNISGDRNVTFDGLARACAVAAGRDPDTLKLVHYDPKAFDFGKRKAFPMRPQHFFTRIEKAKRELDWQPHYELIDGLRDSFLNDYLAKGLDQREVDFSTDEEILA
jgi:nucleoside-diphosphate-sugar epimerase